jgi:uncharacterized membrane protein
MQLGVVDMGHFSRPSQTVPPRRRLPSGRVSRLWIVMAIPAVISGIWGLYVAFFPDVLEQAGGKERMFAIYAIGFAHTAGGGIASLIGPFQFLTAIRRRAPRVHVWLGRAYLAAVGVGALAGLFLSPGSLAANTFGIAFICLAAAWFYTGWMAFASIRQRNVEAHQVWMIRNFALTYAAVTLRVEMPLLILAGMEPIMALNVVGWMCWIPNLLLVEWWMRGGAHPAQPLRVTAA